MNVKIINGKYKNIIGVLRTKFKYVSLILIEEKHGVGEFQKRNGGWIIKVKNQDIIEIKS